jgi:hypothetical protein
MLALESGAPSDVSSVMTRREARIYDTSGESPARALWTVMKSDSVRIDLQLAGFRGTIALGADASGRTGFARSGPEGKGAPVAPIAVVARRVGCPAR